MIADWLPALIKLEDFGGDWDRYINEVFAIFYKDFIESQPVFDSLKIKITKHPMKRGKERGFWHCVQEGPIEDNRTPDLRRCERIAWIRAIIEKANSFGIKKWPRKTGRHFRFSLWFEEAEYLVVLEKRPNCWLLWTAYQTNWEKTKRRLQKEYEEFLKKPTPPI